MEEQTNLKTGNKKNWFSLAALILMGAALLEVILLAFQPAIRVNGTDYCGWQIAFYYWGKQYIYHYHEFGFNFVLATSFSLAVIAMAVALIKWKKAEETKRAVFQFIVAALLIYCGVAFLNALPLAEHSASETMYTTIYYAKSSSAYLLASYPKVNFVVCIFVAAVETVNGLFHFKKK